MSDYARRWTDDEIREKIRAFVELHGEVPRRSDFEHAPALPNPDTVVLAFGSWPAAIIDAGYEPRKRGRPFGGGKPSEPEDLKCELGHGGHPTGITGLTGLMKVILRAARDHDQRRLKIALWELAAGARDWARQIEQAEEERWRGHLRGAA